MNARSAADLARVDDPAWPVIREWIDASPNRVRVIEVSFEVGLGVLHRLQVTASSVLGALALNCGGVIVDYGWFRLLGGGGQGLPDLATANGLSDDAVDVAAPPESLLVGFDVLGGCFAIDGGGLGVSPGEVCYFGPDSLRWDGLGGGHSDFVRATLEGALAETFAPLRWPGWEREIAALGADTGLSLYPPPFSEEGKDIGRVSRRPVPIAELLALYQDVAAQFSRPGL